MDVFYKCGIGVLGKACRKAAVQGYDICLLGNLLKLPAQGLELLCRDGTSRLVELGLASIRLEQVHAAARLVCHLDEVLGDAVLGQEVEKIAAIVAADESCRQDLFA